MTPPPEGTEECHTSLAIHVSALLFLAHRVLVNSLVMLLFLAHRVPTCIYH